MWTLTTTGFYSAVASDDNPEDVVVRARHRGDLAHLNAELERLGFKPAKVLAYAHSDYPWRIVVTKQAYGTFLADEATRIDYRNFKNEVTRRQGHARHDIYSRVWGVLLGLEKLPGAMVGHAKVVKKTPQRPSRWAPTQPWRSALGDVDSLFDDDPDAPLDMLDDPTSPFYIGRA